MKGVLHVPYSMSMEVLDLVVKLLKRDPNERLGAGLRDAEEVKGHLFFKGLNWKDVIQRKLKVPKPNIVESKEQIKDFFVEMQSTEDKVNNWTFISNEFL